MSTLVPVPSAHPPACREYSNTSVPPARSHRRSCARVQWHSVPQLSRRGPAQHKVTCEYPWEPLSGGTGGTGAPRSSAASARASRLPGTCSSGYSRAPRVPRVPRVPSVPRVLAPKHREPYRKHAAQIRRRGLPAAPLVQLPRDQPELLVVVDSCPTKPVGVRRRTRPVGRRPEHARRSLRLPPASRMSAPPVRRAAIDAAALRPTDFVMRPAPARAPSPPATPLGSG